MICVMNTSRFVKSINSIDYVFEKKLFGKNDFFFWVESAEHSFYMLKMNDGTWHILYSSLNVALLKLEPILSQTLVADGY